MRRKQNRYLYLNAEETRLVLHSLIRFKNKLQQQGRYTDLRGRTDFENDTSPVRL